jgi:hypothetical protein
VQTVLLPCDTRERVGMRLYILWLIGCAVAGHMSIPSTLGARLRG